MFAQKRTVFFRLFSEKSLSQNIEKNGKTRHDKSNESKQ